MTVKLSLVKVAIKRFYYLIINYRVLKFRQDIKI